MKFKNESRFVFSVGSETIRPGQITRDFTDKERQENADLIFRIGQGYLVAFDGPEPKLATPVKSNQAPRYEMDETFEKTKEVSQKIGNQVVTYVVADAEGSDSVSMTDDNIHHSLGKNVRKSADYIEKGIDASKFKNGADALEAELAREGVESEFTDEDSLSENESEREDILDIDHAEAEDHALMIKSQGKMGAEVTTAKKEIEADLERGLNAVAQEVSKDLENGESISGTGKVVDFLKQPINAKKFIIAKETDKQFLTEVGSATKSEIVKKLINQRVNELK